MNNNVHIIHDDRLDASRATCVIERKSLIIIIDVS